MIKGFVKKHPERRTFMHKSLGKTVTLGTETTHRELQAVPEGYQVNTQWTSNSGRVIYGVYKKGKGKEVDNYELSQGRLTFKEDYGLKERLKRLTGI